jgi:hypothetical protein
MINARHRSTLRHSKPLCAAAHPVQRIRARSAQCIPSKFKTPIALSAYHAADMTVIAVSSICA